MQALGVFLLTSCPVSFLAAGSAWMAPADLFPYSEQLPETKEDPATDRPPGLSKRRLVQVQLAVKATASWISYTDSVFESFRRLLILNCKYALEHPMRLKQLPIYSF